MIGSKNRNVTLNYPNIKLDNKISWIHFAEIYMSTWLTKGKTSMDIHDIIMPNNPLTAWPSSVRYNLESVLYYLKHIAVEGFLFLLLMLVNFDQFRKEGTINSFYFFRICHTNEALSSRWITKLWNHSLTGDQYIDDIHWVSSIMKFTSLILHYETQSRWLHDLKLRICIVILEHWVWTYFNDPDHCSDIAYNGWSMPRKYPDKNSKTSNNWFLSVWTWIAAVIQDWSVIHLGLPQKDSYNTQILQSRQHIMCIQYFTSYV